MSSRAARPRAALVALALAACAPGCRSEDVPPPEVYTDFESRGRLPDGFVLSDGAADARDASDAATGADAATDD